MKTNPLVTRLETERDSLKASLLAISEKVASDDRSELNEVETRNYEAAKDSLDKINAQLRDLYEVETQNAEVDALHDSLVATRSHGTGELANVRVTSEPKTYEVHNGMTRSFFADLFASRNDGDREATERINRHRDETRALTTGNSSDVVPPTYLLDKMAEFRRSGRPVADRVTRLKLEAHTGMRFIVPIVSGGTAIGTQTTQNTSTGLGNTDPTWTNTNVDVQTIGAYNDVSVQTLRQSGINVDELIFRDLQRAYDQQVETLVVNGTGTNAKGIFQIAAPNTYTYGTAGDAFDAKKLWTAFWAAINKVNTVGFTEPNAILMHPRRANLLASKFASDGRPFITPYAPVNNIGDANIQPEGVKGHSVGNLPVLSSYAVPTAFGYGATPTTNDAVAVVNLNDMILWESETFTARFEDVGSATLTVRLRLHGFAAVSNERYPKSICLIESDQLSDSVFI